MELYAIKIAAEVGLLRIAPEIRKRIGRLLVRVAISSTPHLETARSFCLGCGTLSESVSGTAYVTCAPKLVPGTT